MADVPSKAERFGWRPPEERSKPQQKRHDSICEELPSFFIANQTIASDKQRRVLWDDAKKVLGHHIPTLRQMTGSCVGNGMWNAMAYLMCVEIVAGDREEYRRIFLPYHYGRGRHHSGISGRGEGSMGSGQAKAVLKDGVLSQEWPDLPEPSGEPNKLTWGAEVEMDWSNGRRIAGKWIEKGKEHVIRTTANVRTYEQARDALFNGYPVTVASNRGFKMRPVLHKGMMWFIPSGRWNHQMVFVGVDDSVTAPREAGNKSGRKGGLYDLNSWSANAHGKPAGDEPPGGAWVSPDVADYMLGQRDSYAISGFDGFPQNLPDWYV